MHRPSSGSCWQRSSASNPQKVCGKVSNVSSFLTQSDVRRHSHLQKHGIIHEVLPQKRLRPPFSQMSSASIVQDSCVWFTQGVWQGPPEKVVSQLEQSQQQSSSSGVNLLFLPLQSCPPKFHMSRSPVCQHDSFEESPTRCNKHSMHSTSIPV